MPRRMIAATLSSPILQHCSEKSMTHILNNEVMYIGFFPLSIFGGKKFFFYTVCFTLTDKYRLNIRHTSSIQKITKNAVNYFLESWSGIFKSPRHSFKIIQTEIRYKACFTSIFFLIGNRKYPWAMSIVVENMSRAK